MAEITIRLSDKALRIGLVLLVGAGLGLAAWHLISSGAFIPKYGLAVFVPGADGIVAGSPVLLDGVRAGAVGDVQLAGTSASVQRRIKLVLLIEKRYQNELGNDSVATVAYAGILGEPYVSIRRGFSGNPLNPGDEISFMPPPQGSFDRFLDAVTKIPEAEQPKGTAPTNPQAPAQSPATR